MHLARMLLRGLALVMGVVTVTKNHPLSRYTTRTPFSIDGRSFRSVHNYLAHKHGPREPMHWRDLCVNYLQEAYAAKFEQSKAFREALRRTGKRHIREDTEDDSMAEACPGDRKRWIVGRLLESFREVPPNYAAPSTPPRAG